MKIINHKSTQTSVFNHSSKDTESGKRGRLYKEKHDLGFMIRISDSNHKSFLENSQIRKKAHDL